MRIFLIGLMGSGKTYWGAKIAALRGWKFIDLDHLVEQREQMSIPEMFEKHGERYFRELESKYLKELSSLSNIVVAAGGGTPCFHDNISLMNRLGETYYLKVKPETAARRLENQINDRPLLKGKKQDELISFFQKQLKEREPYYLRASHIIDADNLSEEHLQKLFIPFS